MAYRITGLSPDAFCHLVGAEDSVLVAAGALRVTADAKPGYPCRVSLEDAEPGDTLILVNHVSHDVANPYRASHAIFVNERARAAGVFVKEPAPVMRTRPLSLRAFDSDGMMIDAVLTGPGEADGGIRALFERDDVSVIHAHNATRGCFAALVERAR